MHGELSLMHSGLQSTSSVAEPAKVWDHQKKKKNLMVPFFLGGNNNEDSYIN